MIDAVTDFELSTLLLWSQYSMLTSQKVFCIPFCKIIIRAQTAVIKNVWHLRGINNVSGI